MLVKMLANGLVPEFHVMCSICSKYGFSYKPTRKEKLYNCKNCKEDCLLNPKNVLFAILPIKEVIEKLIETNLSDFSNIDESPHFPLCDITNGVLLQNIVNEIGTKFISLTINTDGVQLFNSSVSSLWPYLLCINNLQSSIRYKQENIVVAGLYHYENVDLQLLSGILFAEIKRINNTGGILVRGEYYKLICTHGSFDLPARAKMLNSLHYNAYCSCLYCLIYGLHVDGSMKFSNR